MELVKYQVSIQHTSRLDLVRDNTANEMWMRGVQSLHQLIQLLSVARRNGILRARLALLASRVLQAHIPEQMRQQGIAVRLLEERRHRHVYRVLVLLEPPVDGVADDARVMRQVEVRLEARALLGLWFAKGRMLAQVLLVQFLLIY